MPAGRQGLLVVLSAPSGAGKDSVLARLQRRQLPWPLHIAVTATTRPRRRGEREGLPYHFLKHDEFLRLRDEGWFLEHAEVYGHLYGVQKDEVLPYLEQSATVIAKIDVQGAASIRALFPDAVLVFLAADSQEELEARMRARGAGGESDLERRLATASHELAQSSWYDYLIVNSGGRLREASEALRAIIVAERHRIRKDRS